jgi:negative regulator of flagellin synthesis FlgM
MKIDQNVLFQKTLADTSTVISAKDGVNAHPSLSPMPTVAEPGPSLASAPLLPSTNGDFDVVRVAKIRNDISAGRYKINTANIADGLLASVRDLIGKKSA